MKAFYLQQASQQQKALKTVDLITDLLLISIFFFLNSNLAGRTLEIKHMDVSSRHRVVDKPERKNGFQRSDIKGNGLT